MSSMYNALFSSENYVTGVIFAYDIKIFAI